MEIDHNKNNELQAKALEVYRQKESELSEILLGSITEDVFNPANIDSSTPIAKMYQNICGRFGQQENIPELQTEFYNIYDQTETEYNYDNLVDEIVRKYDIRIKLNPPIKNMSVNQITLLNRANKHNDRNSPEKDQTSTNNLLHRINIKFCSNCLEKRHKSPQVHTNNDCGHLHPELKR
ncbi:hypothetical protein E3Q06_04214 [Wallemia mellicola]|nr:hypothetical protein E3Q21_04216 [Wallemia mellicola]TIB83360.1 hypothetical protein E3Q20_04198 [Wallemia mellicola]TIC07188.1 hypothetical protein E3Q14_04339 [Wallemia mellicola]TIC37493.1 hypothetical protein E3Q07_04226 [Wallemia mellicola]TIC44574.1 hypothetical protein E3Q06_04214 [Wallemia mellicola]